MSRSGITVGSIRPNRNREQVAQRACRATWSTALASLRQPTPATAP